MEDILPGKEGTRAMKSIAIIGAGPGGICAGVKLKQAGLDKFTIYEQADGVGGTWRHNSYPGCRCDVPSSLYSFSFAQKADWSERYAPQPEILRYMEEVAERFGLLDHVCFNTALEAARWDHDAARWHLTFSDGSTRPHDILISAVGLFNRPSIPDLAGLDRFAGVVFHSARWDDDVSLANQRIAVIGSAASAVQIVPAIAPEVSHIDLYQRTPNYVRPREEYNVEEMTTLVGNPERMAQDRQVIFDWVDAIVTLDDPEMIRQSYADFEANLAKVEDPGLRERLRPTYPFGSKRPLVSSDWFPAFNSGKVDLVTTAIDHVSATGIVAVDGVERPADVIILATGFETTRFLSVVSVTGRDGRSLSAQWADGARAYRGITVPGFPNLFLLYGPNTNNGSILFNIEVQVDYAIRHIRRLNEQGTAWMDLRKHAHDAYNDQLQQDIGAIAAWHNGVPDYYHAGSGLNVTQWPHGMRKYQQVVSMEDDDAYEIGRFEPTTEVL